MRSRTFALLAGLAVLAGCSDEFNAPDPKPVTIRIVNSVWQLDASGTPASAQPRAIDVRFDGSSEIGVMNVPANSITGIDGSPEDVQIDEGVHFWTPSLAAPATPSTSLYSNTADPRGDLEARMYLTPNTQYTLIVSGVAPATGRPEPGAFFVYDFSNKMPLVDDLDPPPVVNGERLARFRLVNAAPFAAGGTTGATIGLQLTEGSTPPSLATINTLVSITSAAYRQQSYTSGSSTPQMVTVTPGDYVVNLTTGGAGARRILQQVPITFESGQVLTFVVQNTAYAAVPGPSNHKVTVLLEAQYE
jgi:hypothetical protein